MKKFIALEGLDGSGKSTQIKLLQSFLKRDGIACESLHFPRSGVGIYGNLIARFLKGEMGPVKAVDPYLVALLYAGDRKDAKTVILKWLLEETTVIADRYVYSNIAYQCAKIEDASEKTRLEEWILHLEFAYNGIPKPDISLYLSVPLSFVEKKLAESRRGDDRDYLKGKKDIHESSFDLQKKVQQEYRRLSKKYDDFVFLDCSGDDEWMLSPEKIHDRIVSFLK